MTTNTRMTDSPGAPASTCGAADDASALMATLLPPEVAVVAREVDAAPSSDPHQPDEALLLHAEEALAVARAVPRRRREFAAGRVLARQALARLGASVGAIPVGADRAPLWPLGVIGSITHCDGWVAAAVAWEQTLRGLGIDAEPARPLTREVRDRVCTLRERQWLATQDDGLPWSTLVFSAKESLYKCVSHELPDLDFHEVDIELSPGGKFVVAGARVPGAALHGRWRLTPRHVLTAVIREWSFTPGATP